MQNYEEEIIFYLDENDMYFVGDYDRQYLK